MFERFTKPARRVVTAAVQHAQQSRSDQVRPEHVLMALLDEDGCLAVRVLQDLGAPTGEVRRVLDEIRRHYVDGLDEDDAEALRTVGIDLDEVVRRIDQNLGGLFAGGKRGHRPFSRGSKKALNLSLREALSLRHNYIGTEHLLLGLVRSDDRVVSDTLARFGIERGPLRAAVVEALRKAG